MTASGMLAAEMIRNPWLPACACLVSLGAGYLAGSTRETAAGAGETAVETSARQPNRPTPRARHAGDRPDDPLLASLLKGRPVQELSGEELVKIIADLSKYDSAQDPVTRARRTYQLQLLLAKVPFSRLEQAAEALATDPAAKRGGSLNSIVSALAAKDPHRALEWAKGQPNPSQLIAGVLTQMARDNPPEAADLLRAGLIEGTFKNHESWQAVYGIGSAMAKLGKGPLLEFLDGLPMNQQGNLVANTLRELPENERLEMLDEIYQRSKDGRYQEWSFTNCFNQMASVDPERASQWIDRMEPGKERAGLELRQAGSAFSGGDQETARKWMRQALESMPGKEKELLAEAVSTFGYHNGAAIGEFADLLPDDVKLAADDLKSAANNTIYQGFSELPDLAGALRDPAEQTTLILDTLEELTKRSGSSRRLAPMDFEILSHRIRGLGLTGENAAAVAEALAAAKQAGVQRPAE